MNASNAILNSQSANLESHELRFKRIAETIPCAIYEYYLDLNGVSHFIYFNDQFLDILDLNRENLIAKDLEIWNYIHPDDALRLAQEDLRTRETGEKFFIEMRVITSSGTEKWVQVSSHQTNKVIEGVYTRSGYVMDITDRKSAEQQLLQIQEQIKLSAIEETKDIERSMLLRDMHDGLGSQLTYARMMIENGQLERANLLELVQDCISDLYLIIDTLSQVDASLFNILVDFRYRVQKRMSASDLQINWIFELEHLSPFKERTSLQILRIVQEALNNSIRHADPQSITLSARFLQNINALKIEIYDDGKGFNPSVVMGRGINNMRKRAREIGADLEITSSDKGTRLQLTLIL
jgi:PAS domain S-box-containing protein